LGTNRVEVISSKWVQDMFKVMNLCFVHSGREVRMDRLLGEKYCECQASCQVGERIRLEPHHGGKDAAMVYTDMGLQDRLVRLEQELQEIPKNTIPTMPGVSSRVIWSDIPIGSKEMPPLFMCQLATMLSLTIQWMVAVFLSDRFRGAVPGIEPAIYIPFLSSLSLHSYEQVTRCPSTPATGLISTSIQALATLCNSMTVSSLLNRPSLTAPRIVSQLISSPDLSLSTPAMSVLDMIT